MYRAAGTRAPPLPSPIHRLRSIRALECCIQGSWRSGPSALCLARWVDLSQRTVNRPGQRRPGAARTRSRHNHRLDAQANGSGVLHRHSRPYAPHHPVRGFALLPTAQLRIACSHVASMWQRSSLVQAQRECPANPPVSNSVGAPLTEGTRMGDDESKTQCYNEGMKRDDSHQTQKH